MSGRSFLTDWTRSYAKAWYLAVMDGGTSITSLETAIRMRAHPEADEPAYVVALRELAARWGRPILEAADDEVHSLLDQLLDSRAYCQDQNRYSYLLHEAQTSSLSIAQEANEGYPLEDPALQRLVGAKDFPLLRELSAISQRYMEAVAYLEDIDLAKLAVDLNGPLQRRQTVVDFIQDSSYPPEERRILLHVEEAGLCSLAIDDSILRDQPIAPKRARLLLKKTIEGIGEHMRLLASHDIGRNIPQSLVPMDQRYPLEHWAREHQEFRAGIREMRDEMLRLGLDRYAPHQIIEDDEEEDA